jgi:GLPGLI family protein
MKTIIFKLLILNFYFTLSIRAQSNNGEIEYTQIVKNEKIKSVLYFTKEESIYKKNSIKSNKDFDINIDEDNSKINLYFDTTKNIPIGLGLYTNLKNNIIIENIYLPKNIKGSEFETLFVKEKTKNIEWELFDETKKLNNFLCQKASCKFRGRTYIVWFTNDIPVRLGPWKLNGLPGLILEAYDSKNQIAFYAEKISFNSDYIIDEKFFLNKNYISPKESREKLIASLEFMSNEISEKIKSSLPRGVFSSTKKSQSKIIDEKNEMEINFDDIN